jgi:hypothetical protein
VNNYTNSSTTTPLAPCEPRRVTTPISHSSEQDILPTASLISKHAIPYRTRSRFEHDKPHHLTDCNRLHHSKPCSNHSIKPHHGHLTSRRMEDHHSQHSTSQTQHHKDGKTSVTLNTAELSNTTNHKKLNPKV